MLMTLPQTRLTPGCVKALDALVEHDQMKWELPSLFITLRTNYVI